MFRLSDSINNTQTVIPTLRMYVWVTWRYQEHTKIRFTVKLKINSSEFTDISKEKMRPHVQCFMHTVHRTCMNQLSISAKPECNHAAVITRLIMLREIMSFCYENKTKIINAKLLTFALCFFKYINYFVCVLSLRNLKTWFSFNKRQK